jgi:hypothetical protein
MMRLHNSKFFGVLLGISMIADAHAATFTLDRDVVEAGGTMVFSITTELVGTPEEPAAGTEWANSLVFHGPSCNNWIYFLGSYGRDYELPFPNLPHPATSWWTGGCLALKPGSYLARFDYYRLTGSFPPSTQHYIELPFTVIERVDLEVTPQRIPVGGTVSLSADVNPGQPAVIGITCPGPGLRFSTFLPFDVDQSVSWPSASFIGNCNSSVPGEYIAILSAEGEGNSDEDHFWVYGDRDGDGLLDLDDNCPNDPNPGQQDADGDDQGDVCDPDDDGDGVNDDTDNCPALANTSQDDLDGDNQGNSCDPDLDGDGVANESDNCPNVANPGQEESCVADPNDTDGDGQPNLGDNCPDAFNPGQQDPDGDGIGTACDLDVDGDGLGNDEEAAAGTDPLADDTTLDEGGVTTLWAGTVLASTDVVEDGETVGVVIDADPDVDGGASIRVIDPVGGPYLLRDFLGMTPFAFAFTPVLPGDWTIEAELGNGALLTAVIHVIPEPGAALGAVAGVATLCGVAAARRRS